MELQDSYKSILEAIIHAGAANEVKVNVKSIHSEHITVENVSELLSELNGVLVAPGFGERGIEGKIEAIRYVRKNNIPFFGICLGMQMAIIEFARTVLGLADANSSEMDEKTKNPVIDLMEDQKSITDYGGTMRLGEYECKLSKGSHAVHTYGKQKIKERHRHRYEFNNKYLEQFEQAGMKAVGLNPKSGLVEIVEIPDHPYFVGTQFHPELKSTVMNPHPLFVSFIGAVVRAQRN